MEFPKQHNKNNIQKVLDAFGLVAEFLALNENSNDYFIDNAKYRRLREDINLMQGEIYDKTREE